MDFIDDMPAGGSLFLFSALIGWAILLLVASAIPGLQTISLRASLGALFRRRVSAPGERWLASLDVFRVLAICWVISNHLSSEGRLDVLQGLPAGDEFKQRVHAHPLIGPLIGNSALGVEFFLVLSGLLAARSWHRHSLPHRPFWHNSLAFLWRRWLRLAPTTIAFVLLASGSASRRAFPLFHESMASNCSATELASHVLLFNNWSPCPRCLIYLWYLGLDWQCHLAAPLILHLISLRPRAGVGAAISLIVGSILLRAAKCRAHGICNRSDVDIPFVAIPLRPDYSALYELYSHPATKCGPFLLGLLLGVFTLRPSSAYSSAYSAPSPWPFRLGLLLAIGTVYGILPEYWDPDQGVTVYNTLYTACFRTMFAGAITLMLWACWRADADLTGSRNFGLFWSVLARLCFATFLIHLFLVIAFTSLASFQHPALSPWALLAAVPIASVLSFGAALAFHCLIEWPLGQAIGALIRR